MRGSAPKDRPRSPPRMSLVADKFPPTPQQLEIIRQRGSNLLIFAGPGTGKTETLARRFASLVADDGVAPSQILVLTFSRRRPRDARSRAAASAATLGQRIGRLRAVHQDLSQLLRAAARGGQPWHAATAAHSGERTAALAPGRSPGKHHA